jgi:2-iminobutanoate/2-iminopropanoate deaminase
VGHAADMAITRIQTEAAPRNPLFAQGVEVGGFVYVSGTVGIDPATGALAGDTIGEQTTQALANCTAIVEAAGGSKEDIVEVGILLHDPDDFAGMNAAYSEWVPDPPPARYAAKLGAVIPDVLVSIRMTAYVG